MTRGRSNREAVRLAVIALAALAVVLTVVINLNRLPLVGGGETYHAEFADTSGLQVGEEVRIAGIKVGEVTDLELDRGRVRVTFQVRGEKLGDETKASIEVKTLLGQHYVSLEPAGDGRLEEGGTIPLDRTTTPLDIVPAVEGLTHRAAELNTDQIAKAFDALSSTLTSATPQTRRLLTGLSRLSRVVSDRDEALRSLFEHTARVTDVVADRDDDLTAILRDSTKVLQVLDRRRTTLTTLIRGTLRLSHQLTGLVHDADDDLGPVLTDLSDVLDVLIENRRKIDATLTYTALYTREFVNVAGSGPWFDTTVTLPTSLSVCAPGQGPLNGVVNAALQGLTQLLYGEPRDCLPLEQPGGGG